MVLLRETISGRVDDLKIGQKKLISISKFCYSSNLNSIYSVIILKLWNIKENIIFFDITKLQNNQVNQLLVHATASYAYIHYLTL
jgi:hypothetical protein